MTLKEMDLGEVAFDRDGDVWVRVRGGAMFVSVVNSDHRDGTVFHAEANFDETEAEFGPFWPRTEGRK